jgi:hypothetical protein
MEIGSSGIIYNRQEIINVPLREINVQLPPAKFSIKLPAGSVVLINYCCVQNSKEGIK